MENKELNNLIKEMTIAEKVGQLVQLTPLYFDEVAAEGENTGPISEMGMTKDDLSRLGSVLGTHTKDEVMAIQEYHLKHNRLGIPLIFMADVIHGYRTIFPVPLGLAASWNPSLVEEVASLSAIESQEAGVHATFSPMVDLVRDPRWGRVMESMGEDPYLTSQYARAFVKGYQGEAGELTTNKQKIAACVKHFVGYGAAEAGRDYNTVDISTLNLWQNYLPPFQAAIDAGVKLVMTAFNTVHGVPATANKWLMTDVLKKQLGFEGVVISDWGAVGELIPHGVAAGGKQATEKAFKAGVDIDMMTDNYHRHLADLIATEPALETELDQAVLKILELKNDLGLFEDPYRGLHEVTEEVTFSTAIQKKARRIGAESMVLLENQEQILPLQETESIALIGPKADSHDLLGAWSWIDKPEDAITIAEGLQVAHQEVTVVPISSLTTVSEQELAAALTAAKKADKVVLALGESSAETGEAASKSTLLLPESQLELLKALYQVNQKIVVVLINGRPLELGPIKAFSQGILEAWFPGTQAGHSLADVLLGKVNPSGKLPMSFPVNVGQVPIYYNKLTTGRPVRAWNKEEKYVSRYMDISNEPLYPFGYGLTYGQVEIIKIKQSSQTITKKTNLVFDVTVKNTSTVKTTETLQCYVQTLVTEVARPERELKQFKQVTLEAGEEQLVTLELTLADLSYIHLDLSRQTDQGDYDVYLGTDSQAPKVGSFSYN